MATEQNRRDADETGTFLDDTASLKDTGFLDELSSDTFEEGSFLDDDVPEEGAAAEDYAASADDLAAPEGAREFEGGEDDYAEDPAAYAYMTQPLAGLTENAPAKEQNPLPEGPEEKEEGRRRGSLLKSPVSAYTWEFRSAAHAESRPRQPPMPQSGRALRASA